MITDRNIVQGCQRQPAGAAGGLADHDPGGDHQAKDHQAQRYRSRPAPSPRGNSFYLIKIRNLSAVQSKKLSTSFMHVQYCKCA